MKNCQVSEKRFKHSLDPTNIEVDYLFLIYCSILLVCQVCGWVGAHVGDWLDQLKL